MTIESSREPEEWELFSSDPKAQIRVDEKIRALAGKRIRLRLVTGPAPLEYVGRVPRNSELAGWAAPNTWGGAAILARPGSHDPANPISPQLHYLKILDGDWCLIRLRVQDTDPLEIRRFGNTIRISLETLNDRQGC
jgi:hypothetical protein